MRQKIFDKTMIKFAAVGVINTLVGNGLMFLLYNLAHFNYWLSSSTAYVIGSIVSYFLNKYFTFKKQGSSFKEIALFALNIAVCYLIAYGSAKPLCNIVFSFLGNTARDNLAMLAGAGLFVVLNYFGQRFLVFTKKGDVSDDQKTADNGNE